MCVFLGRAGLTARTNLSKTLLPRVNTARRVLAVYGRRRETSNETCASLHSCIFKSAHLSASDLSNSLSSVQPTRALHQRTYSLPSSTFWEQRLDDYQNIRQRCWRKASDLHQLIKEEDVDTPQYERGSSEMSELQRGFDEMTWNLLHDLGLIFNSGSRRTGDGVQSGCFPMQLLPVTVSNIFSALNNTEDLQPLEVCLSALVESLERRYGPYDIVQKLANFQLLQEPLLSGDAMTDKSTIYRVLTAYLLYTALTPKDIPGILSSLVLDGTKCHIFKSIGREVVLLKEYFCFLRLYLEICETDDDLHGVQEPSIYNGMKLGAEFARGGEAEGEVFSRQSRRVLSGRLDDCIQFYQRIIEGNIVPRSRESHMRAPVIRAGGLTEEQKKIVQLDLEVGDLLKVKAFAGTGKTRVLIEYAQARPNQRFLFLTFNSSVQKDAEHKFGPNVECRTIHSLARKVVLKMQPKLAVCKLKNDLTSDIRRILDLDKATIRMALSKPSFGNTKKFPSAAAVARVVNETLLSFFSSAETEIDYNSLHWMMAEKLGLKKDIILEWTRRVWDDIRTGKGTCLSHDGYLKILHLYGAGRTIVNGSLARCQADILAFGKYDLIMFDEAQDADQVMAEIIFRQRPFLRTIIVGDPHQMIYEFRGTNNECFDDNLYRPTYKMSLTHSFRFGPGIARAASPLLRALGEKTLISAIGEIDELKVGFPEATGVSTSAPTAIEVLPSLVEGGEGKKHTRIFRRNSSLILYLFSYCRSHPNNKVYLQTPKYMQPDVIFSLLAATYGLVHGSPASFGPLKGIKSMRAMTHRVLAERGDNRYAEKVYKSLLKAVAKEEGVDTKIKSLLQKAMGQATINRELRNQIRHALKYNPNLGEFLQPLLSKGLKPRVFSQELALIVQLEKKELFSRPDFLEAVDFCRQRVVNTEDQETADIILSTAHQAKGLEWSNVSLADEFDTPYIHRYDDRARDAVLEEIRVNYVTVTRARKELHAGQKMAPLLASERGSYRFFLSPVQGECPVCQNQDHQQNQNKHASEVIGLNLVETYGKLIGYEAVIRTGKFGSTLVRNRVEKWPFGDREDVIGCHKCVMRLYGPSCSKIQNEAGNEAISELGRFVGGIEKAVNSRRATHTTGIFSYGPINKKKGWLEAFKEINNSEKKRVFSWTEGHMIFSWGISLLK